MLSQNNKISPSSAMTLMEDCRHGDIYVAPLYVCLCVSRVMDIICHRRKFSPISAELFTYLLQIQLSICQFDLISLNSIFTKNHCGFHVVSPCIDPLWLRNNTTFQCLVQRLVSMGFIWFSVHSGFRARIVT